MTKTKSNRNSLMTIFVFALGLVVLAIMVPAHAAETEETCEAMFVMNAKNATLEGGTLIMKGVSPTVIFFCDRPVRMAGHMSLQDFIKLGNERFPGNPPNATLSVFAGDKITDVVVTVTKAPRVKGNDLTFNVRILEGDPPTTSGPASFFIDNIGNPLSPGSMGGIHRRHRRRARRRCAAGVTCY